MQDTTTKIKRRAGQRELAELLSAVMNHPAVPVSLYNVLADQLCEADPTPYMDSADGIERSLIATAEREARQKKQGADGEGEARL